ncbi:MAG: tetratricopeptide repeat protein [Cyanobacteriota/Melainabacteria group bacterium]
MDSANESITWTNYLEAGRRAFEFGRYADAEKLFQKAHIEARKQFAQSPLKEEPDDGESSSSEGLMRLYLQFVHGQGREHPQFAEIYTRFGESLSGQGNYSRAEEALKLALSVQEKCFGEGAPQVAFTLNKLGQVFAPRASSLR